MNVNEKVYHEKKKNNKTHSYTWLVYILNFSSKQSIANPELYKIIITLGTQTKSKMTLYHYQFMFISEL